MLSDSKTIIELLDRRINNNDETLDEEILRELSNIPLLTGIIAPAAVFMRNVIAAVLRDDMQAAMDEVFRLAEDEIPDDHAESYLLLARNLCASCEYIDGWILFNKNYIRFLLDKGRTDEAMDVICDLEEVLPEDNEITAFRTQVGIPKNERVAIVGLSKSGEALANRISSEQNKNRYSVTHFCDSSGKYIGNELNGVPIVNIEQLAEIYHKGHVDKIIVAFSGYTEPRLSLIYRLLKSVGITSKVFTVPPWFYDGAYDFVHDSLQPFDHGDEVNFESALVQADMSKDVLDFITPLSNVHCNSSCRGCVTASPLADPVFTTLSSYRNDIEKLRDLYWHICRFRISGGEPLLHPDIAEMVKITREAFPATGLAIQTNGLLLLKDDGRFDKLLEVMRENRCGFQISTYKSIIKQRDKLSVILSKHGVQWHWGQISGKPVEIFWSFRTLYPTNEIEKQHNTCYTDKYCHTLYNGYVYPCFFPCSSEIIEKHFNVKFEGMAENMDKMRLNLHDTELDGWGIVKYLESPTPMCGYCCFERLHKIEWGQCSRTEAKLEDFVLSPPIP